jgi:hypothetical protein
MRTIWIINFLLIFVVTILASARLLADDPPSPADTLSRISSAKTYDEMRAALKLVFGTATDEDVQRLVSDPRPEVALAAAWERVRREVPEGKANGLPMNQSAINRFLGFVEGRLHTSLPALWELSVRSAHYNMRDNIWFEEPADVDPKEIGVARVGQDDPLVALKLHDKHWIVTSEGRTWSLPGPRPGDIVDGSERAAVQRMGNRTCIAIFGWPAVGFTLYAVDDKSGAIAWASEVLGGGQLAGGGPPGVQTVRLRRVGDRVIVFGVWGNAAFIEEFDGLTGKNVCRFGSNYFE